MLFRSLFALSYIVQMMNISSVFGIEKANPIERGIFLAAGLAFLLTRPFRIRILQIMVGMLLVTLVSAAGTTYPNFDWPTYLRGLTQILIPLLLMAGVPDTKDRDLVLRVAAWAPIFSAILGVAYQAIGRWVVWHPDYLGVLRFQGSLNPAFLAGFCFAGTYAAMQYAVLRNRAYILVCGLNGVILLLTASRMPLALAVLLCGFIFFRRYKISGIAKGLAIGTAIAAAIVFLVNSDKSVLDRFQADKLSGRELMWPILQAQLEQHPWAGVGFAHQVTLVPHAIEIQTGSAAAHNDYLRLGVELGYPGAIAFFLLLASAMLLLWSTRSIKRDPTVLLGTACFFIFALTDNTFGATADVLFLVILPIGCATIHDAARRRSELPTRARDLPTRASGVQPFPA